MFLEYTHASKFIDKLSQLLNDESNTGLEYIVLLGSSQSIVENSEI